VKVTKKFLNGLSASLIAKNVLRPVSRTVFRKPDGDEAVKTEHSTPPSSGASLGYACDVLPACDVSCVRDTVVTEP